VKIIDEWGGISKSEMPNVKTLASIFKMLIQLPCSYSSNHHPHHDLARFGYTLYMKVGNKTLKKYLITNPIIDNLLVGY
jgi:hypothetical protein